jgi:putative ABC transport system substrate-binding protein
MAIHIRRREFISILGGAAAAWPLVARAQQAAMPVVGFLHTTSLSHWAPYVAAFRRGMNEAGYIEGRNVTVEYRWAEGQTDRLPGLAADLVHRRVAVIAANTPSALAAKAVTSSIPIVFNSGADPVKLGLVSSLNRPGSNVTGVMFLSHLLEAKRLGLIHELLSKTTMIAALVNPKYPAAADQVRDMREAAHILGRQIHVQNASFESELATAFANIAQQRADALVVAADPGLVAWRDKIVALAAQHAVPAIYPVREFADAGGLMSYSPSLVDAYRQVGIYAGKILAGAKPADLPISQSVKFELVINLKTAKALGLEVPPMLIARADEVIE